MITQRSTFFTKKSRGFTLIELLVVIAIIGILSAIVLASLNSARSRAKLSKLKSEFSSIRNQAELHYDETGSYLNMCANDPVISQIFADQLAENFGGACDDDKNGGQDYRIHVRFDNDPDTWYCVNSQSFIGETTAIPSGTEEVACESSL